MLTSLQMGFRTLALEKRSSEVWEVLGAVKTEFGKFGDVLAKTKKKLDEASNTIDDGRGANARDGAQPAQASRRCPKTRAQALLPGALPATSADRPDGRRPKTSRSRMLRLSDSRARCSR